MRVEDHEIRARHWSRVFSSVIGEAPVEEAAEIADEALAEFDKRFYVTGSLGGVLE